MTPTWGTQGGVPAKEMFECPKLKSTIPIGFKRGGSQDHLNPMTGGQRGDSRRQSHSLLTPVGSAEKRVKNSMIAT